MDSPQTECPRSYRSLLFKFWTFCLSLLGGSETMYDAPLGLIGKRIVDFLLVLIELFLLDVTVKALGAKMNRKSTILL